MQQISTPVTTINSLYVPMLIPFVIEFLPDCNSTVDALFVNCNFVVDLEHSTPDFISKKVIKNLTILMEWSFKTLTVAITKVRSVLPSKGACNKYYIHQLVKT